MITVLDSFLGTVILPISISLIKESLLSLKTLKETAYEEIKMSLSEKIK